MPHMPLMRMNALLRRFREYAVPAGLVCAAAVFLSWQLGAAPLVDYDEATYAQVAMETLESGDLGHLAHMGRPWLDKPPLYFWLAMGSVRLFGEQEWSFRLPSVIAAVATVWCLYALMARLTRTRAVAAAACAILMASPIYFMYAREARLDAGVTLALVAALYFTVRGWKNPIFLLGILPALAAGFYIKSFVVFLAIPILLVYSAVYRQWGWIKSKYLWFGVLAAAVLLFPWHYLQYAKFGYEFIQTYFIFQVIARSVTTLTGTSHIFSYAANLWIYHEPWTAGLLVTMGALICVRALGKSRRKISPHVLAPFFSAVIIIGLFTLMRTHLSSYLVPSFPFLAMAGAMGVWEVSTALIRYRFAYAGIMIILLAFGFFETWQLRYNLVFPYHFEERAAGMRLQKDTLGRAPAYFVNWPYHETVRYYGSTDILPLNLQDSGGRRLKAPFYFLVNIQAASFLNDTAGNPPTAYPGVQELYRGEYLWLLKSTIDFTLPTFQ
jgi:4-amino-4-deoxy-L-arabinose transferase-like glycosyltransferase